MNSLVKYDELRFVNDVSQWQCVGCGRVALQPSMTDCGHLYCGQCTETFNQQELMKCHRCQKDIQKMVEENETIKEDIFKLNVHCINYELGCHQRLSLAQLQDHVEVCHYKNNDYVNENETELQQPVTEQKEEFVHTMEAVVDNLCTAFSTSVEILEQAVKQTQNAELDELLSKANRYAASKLAQMMNKIQNNLPNKWGTNIELFEPNVVPGPCNMQQLHEILKESLFLDMKNYFQEVATDLKNHFANQMEASKSLIETSLLSKWEQMEQRIIETINNNIQQTVTMTAKTDDDTKSTKMEQAKVQGIEANALIDTITQIKDECYFIKKNHEINSADIKKDIYTVMEHTKEMLKTNEKPADLKEVEQLIGKLLKEVQQMQPKIGDEIRTVNILLLGETGSGKSTLINAFANYSRYSTYAEALQNDKILCPIPVKMIQDDDGCTSKFDDYNENMKQNESVTLTCKSYVFLLNSNLKLRWIDCPGFASPWGLEQDAQTAEEVTNFITQFDHLDAVAIVMKGHQNTSFSYSLHYALQLLPKEALSNIIFIITNNQSSNLIDDTFKIAEACLNDIQLANVITADNTFCFDNVVVQDLLKKVNHSESNWKSAAANFENLLSYVLKLDSFDASLMIKMNEVRGLLSNINLLIGYLDNKIESFQEPRTPDNLNKEKSILTEAATKLNYYIKANADLHKNGMVNLEISLLEPTDESDSLMLEPDRHVAHVDFPSTITFNRINEIKKQILMLDIVGPKFSNISNTSDIFHKISKCRDVTVCRHYSVLNFNMSMA